MRRNIWIIAVLLIAASLMLGKSYAQDDDRQLIKADDGVKAEVLKEMRGLTDRLDDVLAALAEGDFKEVARIAEIHLGFGHKRLEAMLAAGASMEQIQQRRARMKANREAREEAGINWHGKGGGTFGLPSGPGHKLPEDFWLMGQSMHGAAEKLAEAARRVGAEPKVSDYKAVLESLQEITANCRACHNAFRIN